MTTRGQDNTIERLALEHGGVAIQGGFDSGLIRVTLPNGRELAVDDSGCAREVGVNFSICDEHWSYR